MWKLFPFIILLAFHDFSFAVHGKSFALKNILTSYTLKNVFHETFRRGIDVVINF